MNTRLCARNRPTNQAKLCLLLPYGWDKAPDVWRVEVCSASRVRSEPGFDLGEMSASRISVPPRIDRFGEKGVPNDLYQRTSASSTYQALDVVCVISL